MVAIQMDLHNKDDLINELGELMGALCQKTHCAQWLDGCEKVIPNLCDKAIKQNCKIAWFLDSLTVDEARKMQAIADKLGHWVVADDNSEGFVKWESER